MQHKNAFVQISGIVLGVFMLSACQPAAQPESNVQFKAPERILQVRSVDRSLLSPSVRLSTGETFTMEQTGDDSWSGTLNVEPNNSYFVTVDWKETLPDNETRPNAELLLATWSDTVTVEANGTVVNLSGSNYNYELDDDGDTISNLNERQNDTDPFVFDVILANNEDDTVTTIGQTDGDDDDEVVVDDDGGTTTGETGTNDDDDDDELSETGTTTNGSDDDSTAETALTAGQTAGSTDDGETDNEAATTGDGTNEMVAKASVLIPRILPSQAPDIDGEGVLLSAADTLIGEWANAVQNDNAGAGLWIDNLLVDNRTNTVDTAADGDKLHRWAAMHDGVNLYVVVLTDDVGLRRSDSDQVWRDDALELFIDGNNSKLTEWGDADDFHFLIALQQEDSTLANDEVSDRVDQGPSPTSEHFDFMFSTGPGIGPDGIRMPRFEQDVYELAIPIADAGITIGQPFGFELQIDDDDNGDGRDTKWGWFNPSLQDGGNADNTYLDPSVMGTLILEE